MNQRDLHRRLETFQGVNNYPGIPRLQIGTWLVGICFCVFFFANASFFAQNHNFSQEHEDMVQALYRLGNQGDPMANYHWNARRAEVLKRELATASGNERLRLAYQYNYECLNAGDEATCIREIQGYLDFLQKPYEELLTAKTRPLFELLALAYLRLGENENCLANHSPESCILPLQAGGIHQLKTGSENARALYALLDARYPSPQYKWLYSLASMTLGEFRDEKVDKHAVHFPNWNLEQAEFPAFSEVAMGAGLAANGLLGGTSIEDFNNDGLLDVFVTSHGVNDSPKLLLNDGRGGFAESSEKAGLQGIVGGFNCLHADYDNDGWVDILVLRGAWLHESGEIPNSLLKNMGDGTFQDRTKSSGILSFHPTQTASWSDFDQDGDLDLFIGNESSPNSMHACELFENQGDGTFREVAEGRGLGQIQEYVKACAWGDVDNDGWPDLYLSVLGGSNRLFRNQEGYFLEVGPKAAVEKPYFSFPGWFWDVNNDGLLDLLVCGYDMQNLNGLAGEFANELMGLTPQSETLRLYINEGNFRFVDQTESYGLDRPIFAMGANFGDLDNDGFLDFYLGTGAPDFSTVVPNRMFRNVDGKRFEEVTSAGSFGHIQKGHGIAFADLDCDGDQDIYQVLGGAYEGDRFTNVLYENPISRNNWIVVELEGKTSNRNGIGCRIQVDLDNGQSIYRTVGTGGSFGASSLQQEIGLGDAQIKRLTVRWTSGEEESFSRIEINQKIRIVEGAGDIQIRPYKAIPFRKMGLMEHQH